MKIALNTVCLAHHSLDQALQVAAEAGFTNIELLAVQGWQHVEAGKVEPGALLEKAAKRGLRYSGLHAGGMGAATDQQVQESIGYIEKSIDLAKALAVEHIVFTGWPLPADQTLAQREELCRRFGRALKSLLPRLQAAGIPIALENHYHCQVETVQDYLWILDAAGKPTPLLGVTLDSGHFTASGVDLVEAARTLGPRTINVHVKDHIGTQSVALGQGRTDNAALVRELRKIGFDGYLTVELEVADQENIVRYVHQARPYLEKLLKS